MYARAFSRALVQPARSIHTSRVIQAPASSVPSASQGGFRVKLGAFLVGAAAASFGGYYRLEQDVWKSSEAIEDAVLGLQGDMIATQKALQARITKLEARLDAVEKK